MSVQLKILIIVIISLKLIWLVGLRRRPKEGDPTKWQILGNIPKDQKEHRLSTTWA